MLTHGRASQLQFDVTRCFYHCSFVSIHSASSIQSNSSQYCLKLEYQLTLHNSLALCQFSSMRISCDFSSVSCSHQILLFTTILWKKTVLFSLLQCYGLSSFFFSLPPEISLSCLEEKSSLNNSMLQVKFGKRQNFKYLLSCSTQKSSERVSSRVKNVGNDSSVLNNTPVE